MVQSGIALPATQKDVSIPITPLASHKMAHLACLHVLCLRAAGDAFGSFSNDSGFASVEHQLTSQLGGLVTGSAGPSKEASPGGGRSSGVGVWSKLSLRERHPLRPARPCVLTLSSL